MNPKINIRQHKNSDIVQVIGLLRLNTPDYFAPSEEKDFIDYLNLHAQNYFVVELDHEIIACGGYNLSEDGEYVKIAWDIVHPNWQGKQIGSALLKYRLDKITAIKNIQSVVVRTSQHAFRFYTKFGFELKECIKDYWAVGFDLYYMKYACLPPA